MSVLLLDEIDKAHPDLFNILLQVMDHATLTDNNGKKADFRNIVLIMTTNAGAREMSGAPLGFPERGQTPAKGKEAIEKMFSPEFRNRLDAMITFNSLSQENIERVVDKFIIELDQQLNDRKVFLQLTVRARRWFAERAMIRLRRATHGAVDSNEIKRVLADEILFGKLQGGGKVEVDEDDGKLIFSYSTSTVPAV